MERRKKKVKQKIALLLAFVMGISAVPFMPKTEEVQAATNATPSITAYASKSQMMNDFPLESGAAKIKFGVYEWYILGKDKGVSGDNIRIFAASNMKGPINYQKEDKDYSYTYEGDASATTVGPNHYGASSVRSEMLNMAQNTGYFNTVEQSIMQGTPIVHYDTKNNKREYTLTDKLYAPRSAGWQNIYVGSDEDRVNLDQATYWRGGTSASATQAHIFFLRTDEEIQSASVIRQANRGSRFGINYYTCLIPGYICAASNLNLSSVSFASAASGAGAVGKINGGTTMRLRLNGNKGKTGEAYYDAAEGVICAKKGSNSSSYLVVQGKVDNTDWYYSQNISGTMYIEADTIKEALAEKGINVDTVSLSDCRIWMEYEENSMLYAVGARSGIPGGIGKVELKMDVLVGSVPIPKTMTSTMSGLTSDQHTITWTTKEGEKAEGKAGYEQTYTAAVTVKANESSYIYSTATATVNGQAATVVSNDGKTMEITYETTTQAEPKYAVFATKQELLTSFTPDENGYAANIGKLQFGRGIFNWYILGPDRAVTDADGNVTENTVLFSTGMGISISYSEDDPNTSYQGEEVYPNHYGASKLHGAMGYLLQDNTEYMRNAAFTKTEQTLLQKTTVQTYDEKNKKYYATTDVLYPLQGSRGENIIYAGTNDQVKLYSEIYWKDSETSNINEFWLRSPEPDESEFVLGGNVESNETESLPIDSYFKRLVRPATNLNLSNTLFAASAVAADGSTDRQGNVNTETSGVIDAKNDAMILRLDGSGKKIGTIEYDSSNKLIRAKKDVGLSGTAALVVQGNDGTKDWYYSKVVDSSSSYVYVTAEEIKNSFTGTGALQGEVALDQCRIWIETTEDYVTYATMATASTMIKAIHLTVDTPVAGQPLATVAYTDTAGMKASQYSINWRIGNGHVTTSETTAAYNQTYTAYIPVTAKTIDVFQPDMKVYVNGEEATYQAIAETMGTIRYTFPTTAKRVIEKVEIVGIDTPTADEALDTSATTATTGILSGRLNVSWYDANGEKVTGTADNNSIYTASVTVSAASDSEFPENVQATINGIPAVIASNSNGQLTITYQFAQTDAREIVSVSAPTAVERFTEGYETEADVLSSSGFGRTVTVTFGDQKEPQTMTLEVEWSMADGTSYDKTSYAQNTYQWKVKESAYKAYSVAKGVSMQGTVKIGNACTVHTFDYTCDEETDRIDVRCTTCGITGSAYLTANDKVYDGMTYDTEVKTEGILSGESPLLEVKIVHEGKGEGADENRVKIGSYQVTLTIGDEEASVSKEVTIRKKELKVTDVQIDSKVYDASKVVTVSGQPELDGVVKGDDVSIDLSKISATLYDCNVGANYYDKRKVTLSNLALLGEDSGNYKIDEQQELEAWSIIYRCPVTIIPRNQTVDNKDDIDQSAYDITGLYEGFELSGVVLYETVSGKIEVNINDVVITQNGNDVTTNFSVDTKAAVLTRRCTGHIYDNGFCNNCGAYQPAVAVTEDNYQDLGVSEEYVWNKGYAIYNAGQLYWFTAKVFAREIITEGAYDYYSNSPVILMDDIMVNVSLKNVVREWVPIIEYYANFDGNGHTISGLYCKISNGYAGFFGYLGYYPVKNLTIANSYFEGQYAGGIAGYSESTITRCAVSADVTVKGSSVAGGLVGSAGSGTIENCYSLATVMETSVWGGLVGNNYAAIYNCYTTSTAAVGSHNGNYGGSIEHAYYLSDSGAVQAVSESDGITGTVGMTQEQFGNGELTYSLQSNVRGEDIYDEEWEQIGTEIPQVWYQTLGGSQKQDYPQFSGEIVYQSELCPVPAYGNSPWQGHVNEDGDAYCDNCHALILDATLSGYTLSPNGNIAVNFYMQMDEELAQDPLAYMHFELENGTKQKVYVKDARTRVMGDTTYYIFPCEVAASEMTQEITAILFDGDGKFGESYVYTIQDYANYIINTDPDSYNSYDISIAKALVNYGTCAQQYFKVKTESLANEILSPADRVVELLEPSVVEAYKSQGTLETGLGNFVGSSLVLKSETTLKVFFEPLEQEEQEKFAGKFFIDGTEITDYTYSDEGYIVLAVTNVKAWDLDRTYEFTVSDDTNSYTYTCSPLTYAYNVLGNSEETCTTELKKLVSALYTYQQSAEYYAPVEK